MWVIIYVKKKPQRSLYFTLVPISVALLLLGGEDGVNVKQSPLLPSVSSVQQQQQLTGSAPAFIHSSPGRSCQQNSGPCLCAPSCDEGRGRVSSSPAAGSLPPAGSVEPRPERGGPACCPAGAGSSRSFGSGTSSFAGCLSWVWFHISAAPKGVKQGGKKADKRLLWKSKLPTLIKTKL